MYKIIKCPYCDIRYDHDGIDSSAGDYISICFSCHQIFVYGNTSEKEEPYVQKADIAEIEEDYDIWDIIELYRSHIANIKKKYEEK